MFVKLVENKVNELSPIEQLTIQFKQEFDGKTEKQKLKFLATQDYYPLSDASEYSIDSVDYNRFTHVASFDEVDIVKGIAVPKWKLTPYTEDESNQIVERFVKSIRSQRDKLLAESDWTQLEDVPEDIKLKWKEYRQALRDLPNTFLETKECVWPIQPV